MKLFNPIRILQEQICIVKRISVWGAQLCLYIERSRELAIWIHADITLCTTSDTPRADPVKHFNPFGLLYLNIKEEEEGLPFVLFLNDPEVKLSSRSGHVAYIIEPPLWTSFRVINSPDFKCSSPARRSQRSTTTMPLFNSLYILSK